jgi:PAS domain S-box-containing protein
MQPYVQLRRAPPGVITVFGLAIAILIISVAAAYYMGLVALRNNRQLARELIVMQEVERFLSDLRDMETGQRGFVLTGREEYLEPYTRARDQMEQQAAALRDLAARGEIPGDAVDRILGAAHEKAAELAKVIQIRREEGAAAALALVETGHGKRIMDSIRADVAQLKDLGNARTQTYLQRTHRSAITRTATFIAVTVVNMAFLLWAARVILTAIASREAALQDVLNEKALLSTTLTSIGDAVIVTDTKAKVTFLNTEAERLTGRSARDTIGSDILEAMPISNEQTRQPAENPVIKVLHLGKVVGLANHTVLRSKDGRDIPIEDSAAPVRDQTGAVHGVVMVFRDVTERRKADLAREQLAAIVNSSADAIISKTPEGVITSWNEGAAQLFGWEAQEMIGQSIFKIVPPDLREEEESIMRRLKQGERLKHYETVRLRKDGTRLDLSLSVSPLKSRAGEVVGISNIVRDMTERALLRRTESELAEELASMTRINQLATRFLAERDLKGVLEDMVEAAIAVTHAKKGNLQLFDLSTCSLTIAAARGFSREWLDFFRTVHADGAACGEALRSRERTIVEDVRRSPIFAGTPALEVQIKEGVLAVQSSPLVSRSGELLGILSTHFDSPHVPGERELHWLDLLCRQAAEVLERSRAEHSLRESEERVRQQFSQLESIYETAPLGLCVLDLELRYRRLNGRLAEVNSVSPTAHIGKRVHDIVPSLASQAEQVLARVLETGRPVRQEFRGEVPAQPGVERVWDERWYPIRDAAGLITGVGVVVEEITERKRMESELERARAELQSHADKLERTVAERTRDLRASIAELESFSYSLSHDMRAPLRTIQSFSEIVLDEAGDKLGPMEKDLIATIASASSRLDHLIQDVLTYSRVVRSSVRLSPINVEELLHQIIHERPEFQPPKSDVRMERPLHAVQAHEAYLTQCITNFLDNAIKFVPEGRQPRVRIRDEVLDGQVRLWFEDNGIGIPRDAQGRIFGIFERIHPETAYPGTGIGLAIVRKAAERMHGTVGVESEPGKGSRFWLQLATAKLDEK